MVKSRVAIIIGAEFVDQQWVCDCDVWRNESSGRALPFMNYCLSVRDLFAYLHAEKTLAIPSKQIENFPLYVILG